ncbi:hypothetical protein [Actinoplanes couchii]|uniref:hypothetical protein n=1 Tax=Actinoplanes couchii TaxID=403638 RepID=UPI001942998C|nr:hypothetical protein [Actinoplanes couchii]MDR6323238.1 hypothetical protein [Actinoplanes couchii]
MAARAAGQPVEEKKPGRALDYREEAAELLAQSSDRRRRRTVSGQAKPATAGTPSEAEPENG